MEATEHIEDEESGALFYIQDYQIIGVSKFILLNLATFGFYSVWWMYKAWRYYRDKEGHSFNPALRTILAIIYIIPLFNKILKEAHEKGYPGRYLTILLFIGIILMDISSHLSFPYYLISVFTFLFYMPPFFALNYVKENDTYLLSQQQAKYSGRQIVLLVLGSVLWIPHLLAFLVI
jgi:hypothetical protein